MNEVSYKGYVVRPAPMRLAEGRWNHEVYVVCDKRYEIVERKFSSATTFETEEEAVTHCIAFGKQIIDGSVPGCSVNDL